MSNNYLITGPDGSGKTTVVEKVISNLEGEGYEAGGIYCPEIREAGSRKGFEIVDIRSGESKILAHVDQEKGPKVSKYRVNVSNVDYMSLGSISQALEDQDFVVVDEIAPMEIYSEEFKKQVQKALDSKKPLLAVIHQRASSGFIGNVKKRDDVKIFEVNRETRDLLPEKLTELISNNI